MTGFEQPNTLLEALIRQQQLTWSEAAALVSASAKEEEGRGLELSARHLGRLARREAKTTPYPFTQRALQYAFGHTITELLAPYTPSGDLTVGSSDLVPEQAPSGTNTEVLALAANRAQKFALNLPGMGDLSMEQVAEGVRDLALAYPARPLSEILGHLVSVQDTLFGLLESPQRPSHGRQLYFMASVVGGMLSKASHDLGDPSAALTQSRTAYLCAEQADHNGLRGWISGLQSLVSYWAGRPHESIRYAQRGTEFAELSGNTTSVWLPANEARAWARLGNAEQTHEAIQRAENAWDRVRPDELDELGGLATFSRSRQLYYAADALAWLPDEAEPAEDYSAQAVDAYANPNNPDWAFGDQAGSHSDLAIARVTRGELAGAADAIAPVLNFPIEQRIGGIIKSVQRVHDALVRSPLAADSHDLQEQIEVFTRTPTRALRREA